MTLSLSVWVGWTLSWLELELELARAFFGVGVYLNILYKFNNISGIDLEDAKTNENI